MPCASYVSSNSRDYLAPFLAGLASGLATASSRASRRFPADGNLCDLQPVPRAVSLSREGESTMMTPPREPEPVPPVPGKTDPIPPELPQPGGPTPEDAPPSPPHPDGPPTPVA